MRHLAIALILTLFGCSADVKPNNGDAWRLGADGGEVDGVSPGAVCVFDQECGPDNHCFHPEACGAAAYCKEGYSTCSAAAPFLACSCAGTVESFAAGCPGPYSWQLGNLGYDLIGAACSAGAEPPFDYGIRVLIVDDPVFAEGTVYVKPSSSIAHGGVTVLDESRIFEFELTGDQFVSFSVDLMVDRDGDGACTVGVDEDFATVEEEVEIDLETFEVNTTRYKNAVSDPCVRWP